MSNYETQPPMNLSEEMLIEDVLQEEHLNLLSPGVRIFGLVLMSMNIAAALSLMAWVIWNRNSRVVAMMQPSFLITLLVGCIIETFVIMPMGANDENTDNIDAACVSYWWLLALGTALVQSALLSKLWRVNQIFHAQGFQRKVVTAKDVLRPFFILFSLDLTFLIVLTVVDPPVWMRQPVNDLMPNSTIGYCSPQGVVGFFMMFLITTTSFVSLIFLCIQAYRARDINSDFSEARGVALALFSNLQAIIVCFPVDFLIPEINVDAKHMLAIMQHWMGGFSMMFFIFGPIIAHQRRYERRGSASDGTRTRISGLDFNAPTTTGTTAAACPPSRPISHTVTTEHDEDYQATITSLELELETLRSQIAKIETPVKAAEIA